MSLPTGWIALAAILGLLAGLWLLRAGRRLRRCQDLSQGKTLSLDRVTLRSRRLGLIGRPDRLIQEGGCIIPEEWKSSPRLWPHHKAQMGVYLLLVEEEYGVPPPYGVIVTGDGSRHIIENSEGLRAWVLEMAASIRSARQRRAEMIPVRPRAGQCRACGMRGHCGQARASPIPRRV